MDKKQLKNESREIEKLLKGKIVSSASRGSEKNLFIQFSDNSRLYVDATEGAEIEISITDGPLTGKDE